MPRLMTDSQAASYPTLAGSEDPEQLLGDAADIYAWVGAHELATDERLRARAQAQGIPVDRVNAALAYLQEAGQLVSVPDATPLPPGGPAQLPRDLDEWQLAELKQLAQLLEVDGRSTMNRDELIAALRASRQVAEPEPPAEAPAEEPAPSA